MSTVLNPSWINDTVRQLAIAAYGPRDQRSSHDRSVLPILADALADAGCADEQMLGRLRSADLSSTDNVYGNEIYVLAYLPIEEIVSRWQQHEQAIRDRAAREAKDAREKKFIEARKGIALGLGQSFHDHIADLYASKRASVAYGSGGEEIVDWNAYGLLGRETLTAAELRRTGEAQVERVLDVAAKRVARERLAAS